MGKTSLKGNSGCKLELSLLDDTPVVIKSNGSFLDLDYNILKDLKSRGLNVPEYYEVSAQRVIMRYIDGLTISEYIEQNRNLDKFIEFCKNVIDIFKQNSIERDITVDLQNKFQSLDGLIDKQRLKFNLYELYDRIPKTLPTGSYHGDLTFENILYWNDEFYLIDANYSNLNSLAFDCAKLRQDAECRWFMRNQTVSPTVQSRIDYINKQITDFNQYTADDNLLIFMLIRVIPYCNQTDQDWLFEHINRLWI